MIPYSNCMKSLPNINIPFPTTLRSRCWQAGSRGGCSDLSTRTVIYWLRVFVKASMETPKWRPRLIHIDLGGLPESFPKENKVNFCTMFCEGKEKTLKRPKVIRIKLYRDSSWLCPQENMTILGAPLQIYLHHAYEAVDQLDSQLPGGLQHRGTCDVSLTLLRKSTEGQTLYSCSPPLPSSLRPRNCQSTSGVICTDYFFLVLPDSIHFYFVTINSNFLLVRKE